MNIKLNIKLNMNQQCIFAARKANCMPGCISKNDDMIISLSSAIVRPQAEVLYPLLASAEQEKHRQSGVSLAEGAHEAGLHGLGGEELGMFSQTGTG